MGGAFTAVVLGLAAQQTLGNLFAGLVLLSTRPFRVGDRVRLVGGALAGQLEGIVSSLGLFYTTLISGADRIMVPNNMLLNLAVVPLLEPERVELRARFSADTTPSDVQELLDGAITVPTRYAPHIALEELDRDEIVRADRRHPDAPGGRREARPPRSWRRCAQDERAPDAAGDASPHPAPDPVACPAVVEAASPPALALELGDQQLGVQRGDQVVERADAGLDDLERPVGVDVAGEALGEHLDLLGDERLERPLVAQRVVDGEAEALVVAAGAEAADRLDDPHVRGRVAVARPGVRTPSSARRSSTSCGTS